DLSSPDFETSFAIFHQRFSTNTQPAWRLAQPFRLLAHNGEINTITGNRRWMRARQGEIRDRLNAGSWFSALEGNVSESASLDNALELLVQEGQGVEDAMFRLVPPVAAPAFNPDLDIAETLEPTACEYEPWDGPAALVFSDGRVLGAKLDRNGLRPMRHVRTCTGWLIAGSETGLADFHEEEIIERGRLGPGGALLVDLKSGSVFPAGAALWKPPISKQSQDRTRVFRLQPGTDPGCLPAAEPPRLAAASGWSGDQITFLLHPLAEGKEPLYSMGDDTPPAFLSKMRRTLWDYCKQRFAQVTNPPIDPLREAHVLSLDTRIGSAFIAASPVLDGHQIQVLKQRLAGFHCVDATFPSAQGVTGALQSLERIRNEVRWSRDAAPSMVIISDREVCDQRAALPILLAAAAAWKGMVLGGHFRIPLIIE